MLGAGSICAGSPRCLCPEPTLGVSLHQHWDLGLPVQPRAALPSPAHRRLGRAAAGRELDPPGRCQTRPWWLLCSGGGCPCSQNEMLQVVHVKKMLIQNQVWSLLLSHVPGAVSLPAFLVKQSSAGRAVLKLSHRPGDTGEVTPAGLPSVSPLPCCSCADSADGFCSL